MSPALTLIVILLIPAGVLPLVTAWVLRRYRNSGSQALRDRWYVAVVLALVGLMSALLAVNRLLGLGIGGEIIAIPFALILLAVDIVSGRWLLDYWQGRFR